MAVSAMNYLLYIRELAAVTYNLHLEPPLFRWPITEESKAKYSFSGIVEDRGRK
jgi:hypothetical protein